MTPRDFALSLRAPAGPVRDFLLAASDARYLRASIVAAHNPSRAPEYFAFEVWPGLDEEQIRSYEVRFGIEIPAAHREFLRQVNGASLGSLRVFGIPASMLSEPPQLNRRERQPLDAGAANLTWRLGFQGHENLFHLGGLDWSPTENAGLFLNGDSRITGVLKSGDIVHEWVGYDELLGYGVAQIEEGA